MFTNRSNPGSLIAGAALIAVGLLALAGQIFRGFDFWGTIWPFFIVAVGALFFVGMLSGGKSAAGLAIPGSIFVAIGLMLFLQNLFDHWESWAYGWTVILIAVGVGIYIMGRYTENPGQRESGWSLIKIGAILFVIFGGLFESIFNSFAFSRFLFPAALILFGVYLIFGRSRSLTKPQDTPAGMTESSPKVEEQ
jgi:drug/metabolite transporter (DMT)-like permease